MREALLWPGNKKTGVYYPNSGPGNKYLLEGNDQLGYFGIIPDTDLFTGESLYYNSGLGGSTLPSARVGVAPLGWFKFFFKAKVLFIPVAPIGSAVSWNDLYNAGLVYGEKGNGKYPVGAGVDQFKYRIKPEGGNNWYLKIRMMSASVTDPWTGGDNTAASEYDQLMMRVMSGTADIPNNWENFKDDDARYSFTICKETMSGSTNQSIFRGWPGTPSPGYLSITLKTAPIANGWWKPVLELFDPIGLATEPANTAFLPLALYEPQILKEQYIGVIEKPNDVNAGQILRAPGMVPATYTDVISGVVDARNTNPLMAITADFSGVNLLLNPWPAVGQQLIPPAPTDAPTSIDIQNPVDLLVKDVLTQLTATISGVDLVSNIAAVRWYDTAPLVPLTMTSLYIP